MFERTEDHDLYMEDESLLTIVIKYTNRDVEIHNSHKDVPFSDFIKQLEGVHDFVIINRGVNEKSNYEEYEIGIENVQCSVKLRIDTENNYFFNAHFSSKQIFAPEGENECIKIKANMIFTQKVGIGFWNTKGLIDQLGDISEFLNKCQSLSIPFDDSSLGLKNKRAWEIYAEGMSRLNKEKQTLLPIKSVSSPKKTRNPYSGELINVIEVCLDIPSRQDLFASSLKDLLSYKVESDYSIDFPTKDLCSVECTSFHQFGDEFEEKLNDLAENHCFNLVGGVNYYIKGNVSLKQDNDFDEILKNLEKEVSEYSEDFIRNGSKFISYSDDTAEYIVQLIRQSYSEFLAIGSKKPIIASFQNTDIDYQGVIQNLVDSGIQEHRIQVSNGLIRISSIGRPMDINAEELGLKFEKCTINYNLIDDAYDSTIQIEGLDNVTIPNRGGYYEGVILSMDGFKENTLNWQRQLKSQYGTKFKGQTFVYSYRKNIDIEPLKKLQREVFFSNEKIHVSAMRGIAKLTPSSNEEYRSLIQQIKDNLPENIVLTAPKYSIERDVKLVYEEEEACKRMFNKIRNGISSLDNIITLKYDGVDFTTRYFTFTFNTQEERNEKIEAIYSAFEPFKKVCNIHFDSQDGHTKVIFTRNNKLEDDFIEGFKEFNNESVKIVDHILYNKVQGSTELGEIQSQIDSIQESIDSFEMPYSPLLSIKETYAMRTERHKLVNQKKQLIKEKREAIDRKYKLQYEINSRIKEVLYQSPIIGECYARGYDKITIKLPDGFDRIKYEENPIVKEGEYIYFPMAGSASETGRQKYALDRIEGKKKDNPPINPNLSLFLFNPRYASPAKEEAITLAATWIREYGISKSPLNDMQVEAVAKACSSRDVAFIQGPPGTGKTTVIAEIIWKEIHREIHRGSNCRILLTSQNNLAVDNALERLQDARGLRPVRILNTHDKEDAETKYGAQYMIDVIQGWRDTPNSSNSENAAAHWMKDVKKSALSNPEYEKYAVVIKPWVDCLESNSKYVRDMFADSYLSNVNLLAATCSYCASPHFMQTFNRLYAKEKISFDVVIMDEASKATLPEMAVPMVNGEKIILIGDHRQLPPILSGEHKKAFDIMDSKDLFEESYETLKTSHFGIMFKAAQRYVPSIVSTLTTQYRMHEQIMNTINQFYKRDVVGGLQCGIKETMDIPDFNHPGSRYHGLSFDRILTPDDHAIWINVDTPETYLNPGYKNMGEVDAVEMVIQMLNRAGGYKEYIAAQKKDEDKEIGLITFYSGQRKALASRSLPGTNSYKISAVDKFQGMERNIVIVSTVRSNKSKNIGFARESERINVAFSRAKKLLIVVGNKHLFSQYEDYKDSILNMKTVDYRTLKDLLK